MLTPSRILEKPGRPNAREWQELRIHPELGREICHRSGFDDDVMAIVLHHHERCDGSGYPDRLANRAIPYTVRIVAVMDTFDALTSSRDYRDRLSAPAARTLIARSAGQKYCPWVVSGLLALPVEMLQPGTSDASVPVGSLDGPAVLALEAEGLVRLRAHERRRLPDGAEDGRDEAVLLGVEDAPPA
jgi:response regulator RpfG family c-di-GMP phosphodiesterase